ncbi:hypothetical protein [Mesorhizobium neociceri]|uniref:GIY-YIG domain-containing protein n=1 Tax=Mesorhizobium neociceri TaxID=1307853 RepID=A0A838B7V2_9HYPH|nr:hypothetical protein [Mesorhizobium neociceri]MBA1141754.1 hypothetical protein [Mesorhizobium neociceri]
MAEPRVAATGIVDKPTTIYGLVDPLTNELRYVGKTVKRLPQRLVDHICAAKRTKNKRHCLAWIAGLLLAGRAPEIFELEIVQAGECWVEAEQFWIGYWRFVGADLCNRTIGGEGVPGHRQSLEQRERVRQFFSGPDSPNRGRPMSAETKDALRKARAIKEADPEWKAWADQRRIAGMTEEGKARSIAALIDPEKRSHGNAGRRAAAQTDASRSRVGAQSARQWAEKRDDIIAAQNAGKGDEWRRKQSVGKRRLWRTPAYRKKTAEAHAVKLTAADIGEIRALLASGMKASLIARRFNVDASHISGIKSGRRWTHL